MYGAYIYYIYTYNPKLTTSERLREAASYVYAFAFLRRVHRSLMMSPLGCQPFMRLG